MDHETLRPKHDRVIQSKNEILIHEHDFILKELKRKSCFANCCITWKRCYCNICGRL